MSHRIGSWDHVNQQESSPFFNRIPPELRDLIFKFALAEFTAPALDRPIKHEFSAREDHEELDDEPDMESGQASQAVDQGDQGDHESSVQTPDVENGQAPAVQAPPASLLLHFREVKHSCDWLRPGYAGQRKIHTSLLGTCRRVYLETYLLPSQGSKIFYNKRGPCWCPQSPREYFSGVAPGAAQHIRNLQIFSEVWFLERELMDQVAGAFSAYSYFRRVDSLQPLTLWLPPQLPPMALQPLLVPQFYEGTIPARPLPRHAYLPGSAGPSIWRDLQHLPPRDLSEADLRPWRVTEHLTSLRIYVRRTDWCDWEHNMPLVISPFSPTASRPTCVHMYNSMRTSVEADKRVEPRLRSSTPSVIPRWTCWGLLFLRMPNLQKLTIDFETSEDRKGEMQTIVEWAHRRWRFPVLRRLSDSERDPYTFSHLERCHEDSPVDLSPWSQDMDVLSAADEPVQKTSWRGLPYHFSGVCHACGASWSTQDVTPGCAECTKKEKLLAHNKGPQLLVWTVNWKRKAPIRDLEPGANAGGEGSQERGGQPPPGTAPNERQDGPGPGSAEYHARRQRELGELMRREVMF